MGSPREFEMTEEDLAIIREACKPVTHMVVGGMAPRSPQENANDAWRNLGNRMGFDFMSVRPVDGKGPRCFTAIAKAEGRSND